MPRAIPLSLRSRIIELCQTGKSAAEVSRMLNLGYSGVAKLWRNFRQTGISALEINYHRCGRSSLYSPELREVVDAFLVDNEHLGAPYIRSQLLHQGVFSCVPHERTIQRWWRVAGTNKPHGKRPKVDSGYAKTPHHTWQVDGKEKVGLGSGEKTCYLSCTDEASCGFLQGHVFPLSLPNETSIATASQASHGKSLCAMGLAATFTF